MFNVPTCRLSRGTSHQERTNMHHSSTIPFTVDDRIYNVYLFEDKLKPFPHLGTEWHTHLFAEIHIVFEGSILFFVDDEQHTVSAGQALLIPAKRYHSSVALQSNTIEYTFMLDTDTTSCQRAQYTKELLTEVNRSFDACQQVCSPVPLIPWFYRFLLDLAFDYNPKMYTVVSHAQHVLDYLQRNFQDSPSLAEFAQQSGISERQIQRAIKKETGRTFSEELVAIRMNAADYLLLHSDMTQEQIAAYVGYHTFSGFWKARKKFQKMQQESNNN